MQPRITPGDTISVYTYGRERTVAVLRETADGLLLVQDDDRRYTIRRGELHDRVSR